jgi:hypothetical protein
MACDAIHIALGFLSGLCLPRRAGRVAAALFVAYQAVEELSVGSTSGFIRDSLAFALGYAVGTTLRRAVATVRIGR